MGYDLHLVKTGDWFDPAGQFTEKEWEELKRNYAVPDGLYFSNGGILVKAPEESQIVTLVKIAKENGWFVQGDDGETYSDAGSPIPPKEEKPSLYDRIAFRYREFRAKKDIKKLMEDVPCPFKVGDRVRVQHGRTGGVVVEVDSKANHGCGRIKVEFPGGDVLQCWFVGHPFEKED